MRRKFHNNALKLKKAERIRQEVPHFSTGLYSLDAITAAHLLCVGSVVIEVTAVRDVVVGAVTPDVNLMGLRDQPTD
jgi:hypothetical protein